MAQDRVELEALSHVRGLSDGFKYIAKQVTPSVVAITTITRGVVQPQVPLGLPREFEEFGGPQGGRPRSYEQRGAAQV